MTDLYAFRPSIQSDNQVYVHDVGPKGGINYRTSKDVIWTMVIRYRGYHTNFDRVVGDWDFLYKIRSSILGEIFESMPYTVDLWKSPHIEHCPHRRTPWVLPRDLKDGDLVYIRYGKFNLIESMEYLPDWKQGAFKDGRWYSVPEPFDMDNVKVETYQHARG